MAFRHCPGRLVSAGRPRKGSNRPGCPDYREGMSNVDVVRELQAAFDAQDADAADRLIAQDYSFTSPQDDHLDKAECLRVCFPTAAHFASHTMLAARELGADDVVSYYEYEVAESGERYRNTEVATVRDGQVVETRVFFGGRER